MLRAVAHHIPDEPLDIRRIFFTVDQVAHVLFR